MFGFFVLALPGLMAAGGLAGMVWAVVRMRRLKAAWRSGIEAPGRCLRLYAKTVTRRDGAHRSSSTTLHHVYEFTTAEGEVRRFEEAGGSATVIEGDTVVVRYPAGRPDRATALPPGDVRTRVGMGLLLGFLAVFVVACVGFGAFYLGVFKPVKEKVTERVREVPRMTAPADPVGPADPWEGVPEGFPTDLPGPPPGFP
ncbi:hypothetical protein AF335_24675 [Streptomyces eurocidicus]|uniref:DUF3592 domain-containing protein n=1 Tax=Streptomyces eurocidicus TaxID=66423 RepID=A0A2N8NR41_STREU|nr:DUF3592 domain-containing protein [Streptomyces eurocidicus]MBB5117030.1 hypothetical protein [Streptomyces eurocidicus]MBF6052673.1 hypothetical protein [Streptomyces eurocidicus]PNE31241.1 hypothetical protein AF335_24675 [Streptomyces eurocidicus]